MTDSIRIMPLRSDIGTADRERRSKFPFLALTVGTEFTVTKQDIEACRTALSRYRKANNDVNASLIKTALLDDGNLLVFIPGNAIEAPEPIRNESPTEFELVSHLISRVDPYQSFTMELGKFIHRYDEFAGWIVKLNGMQAKQFAISKDEKLITITRIADRPATL